MYGRAWIFFFLGFCHFLTPPTLVLVTGLAGTLNKSFLYLASCGPISSGWILRVATWLLLWLWNLFFILAVLNVLNNIDYTITYFLPNPHMERRIRARSRLLNISLVLARAKFHTVPPVLIIWAVNQIGREFNLLIHITCKQNYITKWHRHEFQKRWSLQDWESDGVNVSYKFRSFIAPSSPWIIPCGKGNQRQPTPSRWVPEICTH